MRDAIAIHNERVKLASGTANALALGLVGFALLRPLADPAAALDASAIYWCAAGLALNRLARYILGDLREKAK